MKILVVLGFVFLVGCGQKAQQCVNQPINTHNTQGTVFIYGDSISYGFNSNDCQGSPYSWPMVVADKLGMNYVNSAVPGTEMIDPNQYAQLMNDIWQQGDIVIFSPGVNDARLNGSDPNYEQTYTNDLTDILNKAKASKTTIYIGGPLLSLGNLDYPNLNEDIQIYKGLSQNAVEFTGIGTFIDFTDFWSPSYPSLNSDWIHPNPIGQTLLSVYFLQNM